jgi:hypothetical protein
MARTSRYRQLVTDLPEDLRLLVSSAAEAPAGAWKKHAAELKRKTACDEQPQQVQTRFSAWFEDRVIIGLAPRAKIHRDIDWDRCHV